MALDAVSPSADACRLFQFLVSLKHQELTAGRKDVPSSACPQTWDPLQLRLREKLFFLGSLLPRYKFLPPVSAEYQVGVTES